MWERPAADPGRSPKLCPHLEPAAQLIEVHIYTEGTMDPKQNQTEGEMRKVLLGCCLTAMVAVPVIAQGGSTPGTVSTVFQTGFRSGGFSDLRRRETAGGLRFRRQGHLLTLARLSKIAWIDGDVRTSFRSNRPYCTRSTVAEGFALSDTAFALPLHRATRRA